MKNSISLFFSLFIIVISGCRQGARATRRSLRDEYNHLMNSADYKALIAHESFTAKKVREHAAQLAGEVKEFEQLVQLYKPSKRNSALYHFRIEDIKKLIKDAYTDPSQYLVR